MSESLSDVLFHGGATLTVYIDCQQALPEFRNSIITRFEIKVEPDYSNNIFETYAYFLFGGMRAK